MIDVTRRRFVANAAFALAATLHRPRRAAAQPASAGPAAARLIEDLVAANRILVDQGVLDGYGGDTDMLVRTPALGRALAQMLGGRPVVLMRGPGAVAVGTTLPQVVFRSVYTEMNARLQAQAVERWAGP
jgi:hypothetical protein